MLEYGFQDLLSISNIYLRPYSSDLIKFALKLILFPIVEIAAIAINTLNDATDWLEEKIKEFRVTYIEIKQQLDETLGAEKEKMNQKRQEIQEERSKIKRYDYTIDAYRNQCNERCDVWAGWCCAGCKKRNRWGKCYWWGTGHPTVGMNPSGCASLSRLAARGAACASMAWWIVKQEAADKLMWLAQVALTALMGALQAAIEVILAVLKLVELAMMVWLRVCKSPRACMFIRAICIICCPRVCLSLPLLTCLLIMNA